MQWRGRAAGLHFVMALENQWIFSDFSPICFRLRSIREGKTATASPMTDLTFIQLTVKVRSMAFVQCNSRLLSIGIFRVWRYNYQTMGFLEQ
jgi:hypothetical protein